MVPDKAQFTEPPEGYTPAGARETADYLAQRLPVEIIDIAPLLALEDYYRTDPHWRQERLHPVAQALADAMGVSLPDTAEESLHTLAGEFCGSYWGKTAEPLAADVLSYITSPLLDGCVVYDYETDSTGGVYDLTAAEKAPYDLFLSGSKALLRIENPAANNDRTLIVFRDSFGSSLVPLLAQGHRVRGGYPLSGHGRAGAGGDIPGGSGRAAGVQRHRPSEQRDAEAKRKKRRCKAPALLYAFLRRRIP